MTLATETESSARRRLILSDALTFFSLILITGFLFTVTLFLFRSFTSHREELAERWSARGRAAMASGQPDQAIGALRTALRYAPGERSYELLLAQALGDAGHTEESYNYFLGLWETQPGDGFINLRLARLAATKNEVQAAINYYRAAIYGTWEGDGALRRREVRLELARYLLEHRNLSSAQTELLVAGGNSPDDIAFTLTLAPLLEQAGDSRDALAYYERVLAREPDNRTALENAGRLRYDLGHFEDAHRLLERAAQEHTANGGGADLTPADVTILNNSAKILALEPSKKLPPSERVARILRARDRARNRYESCASQATMANGTATSLQGLGARWTSQEAGVGRSALLKDEAKQEVVLKLIFDTETETSQICGMPTGDDALLLLLAQSSKEITQ